MRKLVMLVAIATMVTFASCGSETEKTEGECPKEAAAKCAKECPKEAAAKCAKECPKAVVDTTVTVVEVEVEEVVEEVAE